MILVLISGSGEHYRGGLKAAIDLRTCVGRSLPRSYLSFLQTYQPSVLQILNFILFKAVFLLEFGGGFRISEVVALRNQAPLGMLCYLRILNGWSTVRQLKTDQFVPGPVVALHRVAKGYCPFMALQLYLAIRLLGGTLFLVHRDGAPLTQFQFRSAFLGASLLRQNGNAGMSNITFF